MRLAVVLNSMVSENKLDESGHLIGKSNRIELKVIYFPGSRSSLKEKPYFDDIVFETPAKKLIDFETCIFNNIRFYSFYRDAKRKPGTQIILIIKLI